MKKKGLVLCLAEGFTLVELLLVIGIFAILATLTSINYFSTYSNSNLSAAKDVLIADIKSAQSSAMAGKGQNGQPVDGWGIKVNDGSSYTLFPGIIYDPNNSENNITVLVTGVNISTNLPDSSLSFSHGSGELSTYLPGQDALTLTSGSISRVIRLNQYGTIIGD